MGAKALILPLSAAVLVACGGSPKTGGAAGAEHPVGSERSDAPQVAAKPGDAKQGEPNRVDAAGQSDAKRGDAQRQVELTPEQVARLGVVSSAVHPVRYSGAAEGFGVVLSHELVAQAAADLHASTAAAKLSDVALARAKGLAGGPGALGADALESAERQQAADRSALELSRRKLTSLLGVAFPMRDGAANELEKLADGSHKLLRVTFPADSTMAAAPRTLRISSIDAASGAAWSARTVWAAPQDPNLPGRSMFAILTDATLAEGARVRAQAESDAGTAGVVVPEPAVVVADGQYWCYVRKKEGVYQRVAIDTSRPFGEGYFVAAGIAPGEEVVIVAAGSLLARELNANTEAED